MRSGVPGQVYCLLHFSILKRIDNPPWSGHFAPEKLYVRKPKRSSVFALANLFPYFSVSAALYQVLPAFTTKKSERLVFAMSLMQRYALPPDEIYRRSFETIDALFPTHSWSPEEYQVIRRIVHASGDPQLAAH